MPYPRTSESKPYINRKPIKIDMPKPKWGALHSIFPITNFAIKFIHGQ